MSTMTDTLKEEALFIPSEDRTSTDRQKYTPKVAGDYLGHMTDTRTTVTEWTDGQQLQIDELEGDVPF